MITPDRLRMRWLLCALAVLACVPASLPLQAQSSSVDKKLRKDYALIVGTVWDKQERPVYGARIKIRRQGDKKARWELVSDHSGEFAQRIPSGKAEYLIWVDDTREVVDPLVAKRKLKPGQVEAKIQIENDERADISLHLKE